MIKYILLLASLTIFSACNNNDTTQTSQIEQSPSTDDQATVKALPYEIVTTEPYETKGKAQIKAYAALKSDSVSRATLTATLNDIYSSLKNYSQFKNFSSPTVIAVYLYTSKDKATNMQESWIAMLSKTPSDPEPRISIDDMKLTAVSGQNDNAKSEDEKKLEELKTYFSKRHTDLCTLYKTLYDLEGDCIKKADQKYPDFGIEHSNYSSKLYKQEKNKIFKKYNIHDSLSTYITVFGMNYCK
jgi:hypothetical protein